MVRACLAMIFVFPLGLVGCGKGAPVEEKLVKTGVGLEQAKIILTDYANGLPMGSEQVTFDEIIADVKKTDPRKAAILEKGFADIKRAPANRSATASALLKQL